ncbi:unnamed protein product [Nippostrongylus brasiliensis]|uniref:T-cell activation inhibitor, mitochondrial (inferred by orthology to a human protein) n=1 Tax=Nippostrongylus brasiliensis TaxID=27835 RepID=A0A0N4XWC8_NIPBR|nr:unnamed protein product [Nippostrongylus brasiliensis]
MPRGMTLQEVSVALRPFYFIVHPDRFGRNLRAKEQNEKSLQVLNGYLNDLFPVPKDVRPTSVRFSIFSKDSSLKDIDITLSGTDPVRIVRNALQSCNLNTDNIPVPEPKITEYDSRSFENVSTGDLGVGLEGNAYEKLFGKFEPAAQPNYGIWKLFCNSCTLQKRSKVCAGLVERRNQLQSLRESALLLGVLLGGAHVVIPYNKSLSRTLDQVQQLLKRLKGDDRTMTALSKLGKGTTVEVSVGF